MLGRCEHRAAGDRREEGATLNNIGLAYSSLGSGRRRSTSRQALPLRRAVGDRNGEATTLNNIGGVYYSLGGWQKAIDFYSQALPLLRAVGNRRGEATRSITSAWLLFAGRESEGA